MGMLADSDSPPPEEAGFVELLALSGRIRQRVRVGSRPIIVGRAYSSDLILEDPYVCPRHAEFRLFEGELRVRDLGSVNGIVDSRGRRGYGELAVPSGQVFQLGRARLRFRGTEFPVAATRRDSDASPLLRLFERRCFLLLLGLGTLGLVAWLSVLESVTKVAASTLTREVSVLVVALLVWAAGWSGANRVTQHRWNFLTHCGVACAALWASVVSETLLVYLAFALQLGPWWKLVLLGVTLPAIALPLYGHLRFTSGAPRRRLGVVATLLASALLGLFTFLEYGLEGDFREVPELSVPLKPPMFLLVGGEAPEAFFARARGLADSLAEEPAAEE